MNKKSGKNSVGVFMLLLVLLAVVIGLFNISKLTFVPFEIREVVNGFVEKFFSNSVVKSITVESVGAALLTIFATFVIGGVVKFVVSKLSLKNTVQKHYTNLLANSLFTAFIFLDL